MKICANKKKIAFHKTRKEDLLVILGQKVILKDKRVNEARVQKSMK